MTKNQKKQKKVYTNKGYIGYIYYLNGSKATIQPVDGSSLVECKIKNLNQLNYKGKQEIAFDYFLKEGKINAICFPIYRAGNPQETSIKVSKKDFDNVSKNTKFIGTLEEFREFLQTEEVHEVKVPVEAKVEEKVEEPKPVETKVEEPAPEVKEEEVEEVKVEEPTPAPVEEEKTEDEAEEYEEYDENDSSEYEEYDDESYYNFYNKPSSKREWR